MELVGKYIANFRQKVTSNDFETMKKDFRAFANLLFADGDIPHELSSISRNQIREIFFKHYYPNFCEFLLNHVLENIVPLFIEKERKELFDVFFLNAPAADSFIGLSNAACRSQKETLPTIFRFLRYFVSKEEHGFEKIFEESLNESFSDSNRALIVNSICSFPDRLSNSMKGQQPAEFSSSKSNYFNSLVQQSVLFLRKSEKNIRIVSDLWSKILKLNQPTLISETIISQVNENSESAFLFSSIIRSLPETSYENLFESIFKALIHSSIPSVPILTKLVGNILETSKQCQYLFTQKYILIKVYSKSLLHLLIDFLFEYNITHPNTLSLEKVLQRVVDVWGDKNFIKHSAIQQQEYVTEAILQSLKYLKKSHIEEYDLLSRFLHGIQTHLSSPIIGIRRLGMMVGEKFSVVFDPEHPLKFEELSELSQDSKIENEEEISKSESKTSRNEEELSKEIKKKKSKKNEDSFDDPDRPLFGDDFSENSENEEDEDDLVPYNLEDDESDLTPLKTPMYLRECISGLRNTEDPLAFEGALLNTEKLIREHIDELCDVSKELASLLIHLQSPFLIKDFDLLKKKSMIAILVCDTNNVVGIFIREFYGKNVSMQQRSEILDTLEGAAQELAQLNPADFEEETISPIKKQPSYASIIQERVEKNTRRWGKLKKEIKAAPNRFRKHAPSFFYPLITQVDSTDLNMKLFSSDSYILSRLIHTLGVFFECLSPSGTPETLAMCKILLELIHFLKYHDQSTVRRSCIYAVISSLGNCIPGHFLVIDFGEQLNSLNEWLSEIIQNDPDEHCRLLANFALATIVDKVKEETNNADSKS